MKGGSDRQKIGHVQPGKKIVRIVDFGFRKKGGGKNSIKEEKSVPCKVHRLIVMTRYIGGEKENGERGKTQHEKKNHRPDASEKKRF